MFLFIFFLSLLVFFFFNDTATTEIYTLSLHDALPISPPPPPRPPEPKPKPEPQQAAHAPRPETTKPDPKAFDKLLKNLEDKRPEPAAFDNLLKNLTREQVAQAEDAPPAPHRIAATAPPSSQPKAPLGSQLTASELDALRQQVMQQLIPC